MSAPNVYGRRRAGIDLRSSSSAWFALAWTVVLSCGDAVGDAVGDADASGPTDAATDAAADVATEASESDGPIEADFYQVAVPFEESSSVTSMWGSTATDIWAVGTYGAALHFDGNAWSSHPLPLPETVQSVWADATTGAWLVTAGGSLFRSSSSDAQRVAWRLVRQFPAGFGGHFGIWGVDGRVFVGGGATFASFGQIDPRVIEAPTNLDADAGSGGAWTPVFDCGTRELACPLPPLRNTLPPPNSKNFRPWQPSRILAGTGSASLWFIYGLGAVGAVRSPVASATGDAGLDGAAPGDRTGKPPLWTELDTASDIALYAVWAVSPSEAWMVGEGGRIRHFHGDSRVADVVESPTVHTLYQMWGSGPSDIWAVGESATILHYDGMSWSLASVAWAAGSPPDLYTVWGDERGTVWVGGQHGIMFQKGAR